MTIIDNLTDNPLERRVEQVLAAMFAAHERVVVKRPLTGGLSGSRVFLIRPYRPGSVAELPSVVKIDYHDRIQAEWKAYQQHVEYRVPYMAEIRGTPTFPPGNPLGGLWYPLVGANTFEIASFRDYYRQASSADIRTVLADQMCRSLGQLWQHATFKPDILLGREYDDFLPPNLRLRLLPDGPPAGASPRWLHAHDAHYQAWQVGDVVQLSGFEVLKKYRGAEPGFMLDYPAGQPERYRVRLGGVGELDAYQVGDVLQQPLLAQVYATRQETLRRAVREALGERVDPDAETVTLGSGARLPNPLHALPTVARRQPGGLVGAVHGDLNLENVLVQTESRTVNLIDFAMSGRRHVIRDLLHLEMAIVTQLLPAELQAARLTPEALDDFYRRLACAWQGDTAVSPAGLEKAFDALLTLRQAATPLLRSGWQEYTAGLFLYLVGSLRFGDLSGVKPVGWAKQCAFWGAAVLAHQLQQETPCPEPRTPAGPPPAAQQRPDTPGESTIDEHDYTTFRNTLLAQLRQYFDQSDLRDICFKLGVDYEDLAGTSKQDKTRELILHMERNGRIDALITECRRLRPTVSWQDAIARFVAQEAEGRNPPPPPVDKRTLLRAIVAKATLDDVTLWCALVEGALRADGMANARVDMDIVGGNGLSIRVLNLITYLDNRGWLPYLITVIREENPNVLV